jgi:hypothetical protein
MAFRTYDPNSCGINITTHNLHQPLRQYKCSQRVQFNASLIDGNCAINISLML